MRIHAIGVGPSGMAPMGSAPTGGDRTAYCGCQKATQRIPNAFARGTEIPSDFVRLRSTSETIPPALR
jgi:hypothetical protein